MKTTSQLRDLIQNTHVDETRSPALMESLDVMLEMIEHIEYLRQMAHDDRARLERLEGTRVAHYWATPGRRCFICGEVRQRHDDTADIGNIHNFVDAPAIPCIFCGSLFNDHVHGEDRHRGGHAYKTGLHRFEFKVIEGTPHDRCCWCSFRPDHPIHVRATPLRPVDKPSV